MSKKSKKIATQSQQMTHHYGAHLEIHKVLYFSCHLTQKHESILAFNLKLVLLKSLCIFVFVLSVHFPCRAQQAAFGSEENLLSSLIIHEKEKEEEREKGV